MSIDANMSFSLKSETKLGGAGAGGVFRCGKGVMYLMSLGHPADTGLPQRKCHRETVTN